MSTQNSRFPRRTDWKSSNTLSSISDFVRVEEVVVQGADLVGGGGGEGGEGCACLSHLKALLSKRRSLFCSLNITIVFPYIVFTSL